MNFALSENEEMLKALAERFVLDRYDLERRRTYQQTPTGYSADNWHLLGELGLLAAPLPESCGGLDVDGTSLAVMCEALGHGLVVEPVIENVILAARLLATTGSAAAATPLLNGLVTGEARIAVAHAEAGGRGGRMWIETSARREARGWVLSGHKSCVPAGAGAQGFIVSARTTGQPGERTGLGLWLVPEDVPGLVVKPWRTIDGGVAVSLDLSDVHLEAAAHLADGIAELDAAQAVAQLARGAEALGIMERMLAETAEYLRTREQFGQKLSSFQALQHRMVAQYAVKEKVRGLLNRAVVGWGGADFARTAAGLGAYVAKVALGFGHDMIQFHGGMGVTDELAIGHAHKRLVMLSRWPHAPEVAMDLYANRRGEGR